MHLKISYYIKWIKKWYLTVYAKLILKGQSKQFPSLYNAIRITIRLLDSLTIKTD